MLRQAKAGLALSASLLLLPVCVMTGAEGSATTTRSYHAQVSKGASLYLSDNGGNIAENPSGVWSSVALTGLIGNTQFA